MESKEPEENQSKPEPPGGIPEARAIKPEDTSSQDEGNSTPKKMKPYKPRDLNEFEAKLYAKILPELLKTNYHKSLDEEALKLYLRHMYYCEECKKAIERDGLFLTSESGKVSHHPAWSTMRQNSEVALRWARLLGISAYARKQLGIALDEAIIDDDLFKVK